MDMASVPSESFSQQYDGNYTGFRSDPYFQIAVRQELTKNLIPRVSPPAEVLDVGCGNGDFLTAATEVGYTGLGIDISAAAVARCQERGLHAEVMDFTGLQERDRFDLITMWDVVEHLPDPNVFINRAFQLLRPGGYLLIKTPRVSSLTVQVVKIFPRLAGTLLQTPNHIQFFNRSTFATLLDNNGFKQIDWLKDRHMRSRPPIRSLRKAVSRLIRTLVDRLGRNGNFYVMAQKPYGQPEQ
jgi:2-polyprenyl-3-methyl-5-hydroxy-6-metoxy-1,4-benzoquinol methylase